VGDGPEHICGKKAEGSCAQAGKGCSLRKNGWAYGCGGGEKKTSRKNSRTTRWESKRQGKLDIKRNQRGSTTREKEKQRRRDDANASKARNKGGSRKKWFLIVGVKKKIEHPLGEIRNEKEKGPETTLTTRTRFKPAGFKLQGKKKPKSEFRKKKKNQKANKKNVVRSKKNEKPQNTTQDKRVVAAD